MQHARLCTLLEKPLPDVTLSKRPSWQHLQTYAAKVGVLLGRVGKDRSSVSVGYVQMLARSAMGYVLRLSPKGGGDFYRVQQARSEEHTSELQSLMRSSYAVFCLKKKKKLTRNT